MQNYQTGDSLIFKVPEREISLLPAALYPEAFPVAEAEAVIQPIALSIHSWVVQTPYDLIVIDTATGNGPGAQAAIRSIINLARRIWRIFTRE